MLLWFNKDKTMTALFQQMKKTLFEQFEITEVKDKQAFIFFKRTALHDCGISYIH